MTLKINRTFFLVLGLVVSLSVTTVAVAESAGWKPTICCGLDEHFNTVDSSGATSNEIGQLAFQDVSYPLQAIHDGGGFLERQNLRERLLRFNSAHKIGYVYLLSFTGKPIGYYTILGKVSATESQLTIPEQPYNHNNVQGFATSPGDDGSYGHNEGGSGGVFFFTTNGTLVETDQNWLYSDAPLPLSVPSLNPIKAPSSITAEWKQNHTTK